MSQLSRAWRRIIGCCTVVALLLTSEVGFAEQAVPVRVVYQVARGCPAKARFVARVRLHTSKVEVSHSDAVLLLDVRVSASQRGYSGRLRVVKPDGGAGVRHFTDEDCTEVVSALALSAALSIDPEATLAVAEDDSSPAAAGDADTAAETSSQSTSGDAPAKDVSVPPEASGETASSSGQDDSGSDPGAAATEGGLQFSLGGFVQGSFVFKPKALVGGGVSIALAKQAGRSVLPLDLALHLAYLTSRPTRGQDPLLLDEYVATLEYCPLSIGTSPYLVVCGGVQAGALRAEGVDLQVTGGATRGYFALQAGGGVRLPVGSGWLVAAGTLDVPLVRRAFAIDPGTMLVTSSRTLGGSVRLGAMLGF